MREWRLLDGIRRWAVSAGFAVATLTVISTSASGAEAPTAPRTLGAPCNQNRVIIQIHGSGSTGEFATDVAVDPNNPAATLSDAARNEELKALLANATGCRIVTFSYDDMYLALPGQSAQPGINAWNDRKSPWDVMPEVLAGRLQRLIDRIPNATFDIVAYSAGGMVATYFGATESSSARARVRSIIVVDGIVSGADWWVADLACALPAHIRNAPFAATGALPCHLRSSSEYTTRVRTWTPPGVQATPVPLATLRAKGDRIVWHEWASLSGSSARDPRVVEDPDLQAPWSCDLSELGRGLGYCLFEKGHGAVLTDPAARAAIDRMLDR